MTPLDRETTAALFRLTPDRRYRPILSPDDWGDPETAWAHVKRDMDPASRELGRDFGVYLGPHAGRYVVAVTDGPCGGPAFGEAFDSLDALKSAWMID